MTEYAYEIIGGFLIVISSLVGEQMTKKWKVTFYLVFSVIAVSFAAIGIHVRREAATKEAEERKERTEEVNSLKNDVSRMIKVLATIEPNVEFVRQELTEKRSPSLKPKADDLNRRKGDLVTGTLAALVPSTVKEIRSWKGDWNSPEGKTLITNAAYIRQGLLQGVPLTPDDQAAGEIFGAWSGGFTRWNPNEAANYLERLVTRLRIAPPPVGLTGEAR